MIHLLTNEELNTAIDDIIKLIKQGWCQGMNYKDSDGNHCSLNDEKLAKYCLLGALYKVAPVSYSILRYCLIGAISHALVKRGISPSITDFNDNVVKTKEEVILLLEDSKWK